MQLSQYESQVNDVLQDITGWSFTKQYDADEECNTYSIIDSYGDVNGDPCYEFEDLLDFICESDEVQQELERRQLFT